jgi:hypothetical protein
LYADITRIELPVDDMGNTVVKDGVGEDDLCVVDPS